MSRSGKVPATTGRNLSAFDIGDQVLEHDVVLKRAPEQRQVLEIERSQVEPDDRAGDCSGRGIPTSAFENVEQRRPDVARDEIDDDIDGITPDGGGQIGIAVDNLIGADCADGIGLRRAGNGDDMRAATLRQLHRRPDPTPPDAPVTRTLSAPTDARCSMFSAVNQEHGTDASSASVQSQFTAWVSRDGALAYCAKAPSHSDPNVQHSNGRYST